MSTNAALQLNVEAMRRASRERRVTDLREGRRQRSISIASKKRYNRKSKYGKVDA